MQIGSQAVPGATVFAASLQCVLPSARSTTAALPIMIQMQMSTIFCHPQTFASDCPERAACSQKWWSKVFPCLMPREGPDIPACDTSGPED